MDFPKGYIQEKTEYRTNEAERKLYVFLKNFFNSAYTKTISSIQYYLFNKQTVHGGDKFQVGSSIQVSNQGSPAVVNVLRTGGTDSSPTQTPADTIGGINAYSYDGTNYATTAAIEFVATEPASAGARGTYINFRTTPTGSNVIDNAGFINAAGSWASGKGLLATNATTGFLYIPTCAGVPTGVPETVTGRIPLIADTSGNKIYAYLGGWIALN